MVGRRSWMNYTNCWGSPVHRNFQMYVQIQMYVKHLQEYLDKFTEGPNGRKGNAVSNATIYMQVGKHLEKIGRIEVQEANIIGQNLRDDPANRNLVDFTDYTTFDDHILEHFVELYAKMDKNLSLIHI